MYSEAMYMNKMSMKQSGFTLLEILISVGMFAIISGAAYMMLHHGVQSQKAINARADRFHQLQKALFIMQRDIEQITNRPVRDEQGNQQAPFYTSYNGRAGQNLKIAFTHTGWTNPFGDNASNLQRVNYFLHNEQLIRRSWDSPDRTYETKFTDKVMMSNVLNWQVRLLDDGSWYKTWKNDPAENNKYSLPDALEFQIALKDMGNLKRIFKLVSES